MVVCVCVPSEGLPSLERGKTKNNGPETFSCAGVRPKKETYVAHFAHRWYRSNKHKETQVKLRPLLDSASLFYYSGFCFLLASPF
jgi:hypothetical protein